MPVETVDSDMDDNPRFKLDSESMNSENEHIGEIEEMKERKGHSVLKKVPNALHHHVVFPMAFPHVGMIHHNLKHISEAKKITSEE